MDDFGGTPISGNQHVELLWDMNHRHFASLASAYVPTTRSLDVIGSIMLVQLCN